MTRIGAFMFGTASGCAALFLGWYLNGHIFETLARWVMTGEITDGLKFDVFMVLALFAFLLATDAFYKFAFTRPKIEIIPPTRTRS